MILNISGRTDIVAFYSDWLIKRFEEGFVDVRNPFYPKNVSRINFDNVDGIVFCTKNPIPIVDKLDKIKIPYIFHVTLTPYKKDIEPNVPPKGKIIEAIKAISRKIGKDNIYIRYDPIFISNNYPIEYHIKAFDNMCGLLDGYVSSIIVSFIDDYKNVRKNMNVLKVKKFIEEEYEKIGVNFSNSAKKHGMTVQTCAEERNLEEYGFLKRDCITKEIAQKLTGKDKFKKWKSRNRETCNCVEMVDIGVYNSCMHLCKYCYANYDEDQIFNNVKNHIIDSSLLISYLDKDDVIKERK